MVRRAEDLMHEFSPLIEESKVDAKLESMGVVGGLD